MNCFYSCGERNSKKLSCAQFFSPQNNVITACCSNPALPQENSDRMDLAALISLSLVGLERQGEKSLCFPRMLVDLSMSNSLLCPFVSEEVLLPYLKVEFKIGSLLLHFTGPILHFYSCSIKSKVFVRIPNTLKIGQKKNPNKEQDIMKIMVKALCKRWDS